MNYRHGRSARPGAIDPLYSCWKAIVQRCTNPKNPAWENYGGRGITVHPEWVGDFAAFARDVGEKPSRESSIDRINNDGNYEPGNVRWADRRTQMRNRRGSLTEEQVREILQLLEQGQRPKAVAARFSVSGSYVSQIARRKCWTDIGGCVIDSSGASQNCCIHGHEYTPDNTYLDGSGGRRCRTCARERYLKNRLSALRKEKQ